MPNNIRTCLPKQDQPGSYVWVAVKLIFWSRNRIQWNSSITKCHGTEKIVRYSGVYFHIFYSNSAGLSDVFRYNGVLVIAGFHCTHQLPLFKFIYFIIQF